jgi:ankyrin repeat protein
MSDNAVIAEGIAAARAGDVDKLSAWLEAGNDPNQYDATGWTPLLWASARGNAEAVRLLLDNEFQVADINIVQRTSKALPIHLAGQSGDIETAKVILDHAPDHLDAILYLNGHNAILQAVFYGHPELAKFLLEKGADTSITTARGLGPMELMAQFQNETMMDIIRPYDSSKEAKAAYYQTYLDKIAPDVPEDEVEAQQLADELVAVIENGLKRTFNDPGAAQETVAAVKELVEVKNADVNRLGGLLQQPSLIVTVTGNNGFPPNPNVTRLRNELAAYLLEKGADPTLHENHPMDVQTIIRAAVFNHLDILKMCGNYITPQQLTDCINEIPAINGLTAMHDTVLRATMAAPEQFEGYLDQARWLVSNGGRVDIEDFSGVTQRNIAERVENPEVRRRLLEVLDGGSGE